jgi:RNA polymerase sigma factor (sigma-70 family)
MMSSRSLAARKAAPVQSTSKKAPKLAGGAVINFLYERSQRRRPVLSKRERERLVLEFRLKARKLARSILRKWHARLDLEEIDSVVDLSLCEAVRRFNPNMGASFMTFLFYHLRGNLIRSVAVAASASTVPGVAEAAARLKSPETAAGPMPRVVNAIEVAEALCNHDYMLPDEIVFKKELADLSEDACSKLDQLEREVIDRIYIKGQQLMDVAHSLGYSRCHISRVKKRALETLYEELTCCLDRNGRVVERDDDGKLMRHELSRREIHRRKPRSKKAIAARIRCRDRIAA